ncbi:Uncharacterized protein FWK35_00030830, partial [Aphis craccivora]
MYRSKLPSNLQVLKTLFFNIRVVNLNLRESARLIVREVLVFWEKARIPVRLEKHCIISKVESLYDEWRTLQKHAAKNTASHREQEDLFILKFKKIKDIINPHLTRVLEFVKEHLKILQLRNDYKELLELTMIFLGDKPNNTIFFHTPGAIHHARWMAKAIYCLKAFMFRNLFKLTISEEDGLRDICIFIVRIYIEAWFKAPSAAAAPYQDLLFIRKLY